MMIVAALVKYIIIIKNNMEIFVAVANIIADTKKTRTEILSLMTM